MLDNLLEIKDLILKSFLIIVFVFFNWFSLIYKII